MRIAIIGRGWRAQWFARAIERLDGVDLASMSGRDDPVDDVLRGQPDAVIVSVPWEVSPRVIRRAVDAGLPVLAETPPAPDAPGLAALWGEVGAADLVQVAEQYPRYPMHLARRAVVESGAIGRPTSVHVSSTHGYHAVAVMRSLLGVGAQAAQVSARVVAGPLADPIGRDGLRDEPTRELTARTVLALIEWEGGASGVYDFTDNQWHNPLRHRRTLVRGSRGEISDEHVVRLRDSGDIVTGRLERRQLGYELDLEGYDTDHIAFDGEVLWRNPWRGQRWSDEEIAIGSLLGDLVTWVRGEAPAPYPLAEGAQDHTISLAIDEAVASGETVQVATPPWASGFPATRE